MTTSNPYGDLELTDPQAMRALAHPVRLAILDQLRRGGPATATELSPTVGATPSVTSWHLRHLEHFGLVQDSAPGPDRRARRWESVGRGFRFASPSDPGDVEGQAAARVLSHQMFLQYGDLPGRWVSEVEPELEPAWRRLAGLSITRVVLSQAELEAIEEGIEALLAPYVTREPSERPVDGRGVRLMRYVLPDLPDESRPVGEASR